jgi:hypothetical protein
VLAHDVEPVAYQRAMARSVVDVEVIETRIESWSHDERPAS